MKSPIDLLSSLMTDVKRLEPGVKGLDRDLVTIKSRYKHEGMSFLTHTLPSLYNAFVRGLADSRFTCPPGFRKVRGGAIPRLFSGMLCEVFDTITGDLKVDASLSMVKAICETLQLFKKLTLRDDLIETLDRSAKSKFFKDEETVQKGCSLDERELFILDRVCRMILPNLDAFDIRELPCKHGPGAVAESVTANQKWSVVSSYSWMLEEFGFDIHTWITSQSPQTLQQQSLSSSAKLITVPKNSTSRRTITIEPILKQFLQQGYNQVLRENITKCKVLNQCLALTDQTANQKLAIDGSLTGKWSTIDLSSASDLLSKKMVELVFKHRPVFLDGILNCRSSHVSCDGRHEEIEKFAGMGNATTFPVQSVVFAVLAICAQIDGKFPTYGRVVRAARRVRVFGDDIIVPADTSHQVVHWITAAGLTVNHRKSFLVGNFKESCGVDAFRGVDVTPLYVRHHPMTLSLRVPSTIAHYVSLCNQAWLRGLYALSARFQAIAEEAIGSPLPLVTSNSSVLGLVSRQEAYSVHRWNEKLQRPELRGLSLSTVYRKDKIDGYAALLKCQLSPFLNEDKRHLERSPVRFLNKAYKRWVAC